MRIEADHGQGGRKTGCGLARRGDHRLVATVNTVKSPHGNGGVPQTVGQFPKAVDDLDRLGHCGCQPFCGRRRRGTRTTATPSMIFLPATKPSQFSSTRALS